MLWTLLSGLFCALRGAGAICELPLLSCSGPLLTGIFALVLWSLSLFPLVAGTSGSCLAVLAGTGERDRYSPLTKADRFALLRPWESLRSQQVSTYPSNQQLFIEHLPHSRHWGRYWGYDGKLGTPLFVVYAWCEVTTLEEVYIVQYSLGERYTKTGF